LLSPSPVRSGKDTFKLITLKKRKDFQATSGGLRFSAPAFTMLRRVVKPAISGNAGDAEADLASLSHQNGPFSCGFGFTVTKKLGNAVVRNRIRRRLKAAVFEAMRDLPAPLQPIDGAKIEANQHDFVILARITALTHPFDSLCADITRAITRLMQPNTAGGASPKPRAPAKSTIA
jgi:ribonuclease P protein component